MRKRGDVSSKIKAMAALEAIKAHEPISDSPAVQGAPDPSRQVTQAAGWRDAPCI